MEGRRKSFAVLVGVLVSNTSFAHVKWFHEGESPTFSWAAVFSMPTIAFILAVSAVVAALWFFQRARGGVGFIPSLAWFGATSERRAALFGLVPAILAVHFAIPLFVAGVQGNLFSPELKVPGASAYFLGLLQAALALSLFYGGFARAAAVVLGLLWVASIKIVGLEAALDNAHVLGFAGFFYLAGRGPISVDRLIFSRFEPGKNLMEKAVTVLRIGVGFGLLAAALSEKLGNPSLALSFLEQNPLNFTSAIGLPMSDQLFINFAGSVELLVGLCLIFNVFVREIVVIAWFPLNLTLTIFDWTEFVGHLPIYGAMSVLLIWENSAQNMALWTQGMREGPLAVLPRKN